MTPRIEASAAFALLLIAGFLRGLAAACSAAAALGDLVLPAGDCMAAVRGEPGARAAVGIGRAGITGAELAVGTGAGAFGETNTGGGGTAAGVMATGTSWEADSCGVMLATGTLA